VSDARSMVLVTGAAGWLGTRLVECLAGGLAEVDSLAAPHCGVIRCLVRRADEGAALRKLVPRVETVVGDVTDLASLGPFFDGASDAILFHICGVIHPSGGVSELFAVNEQGTRNVIEAAGSRLRRIVHVSSNSPVGCNRSPTEVFDENAPYRPYMAYGRSKMAAELVVREAGSLGLNAVIIRPPWFYGPHQPARQTLFFKMIREGRFPLLGGGANRRSMAYVDNICQGLLLAARAEAARGQTYWIADRRPYPMAEVVATVENVMEEDFGVVPARKGLRLPSCAGAIAFAVDASLQAVGLYHQKIHVLSEMNKTIACSIAKAERELGFAPRVDLREGMRRSLRWMVDRGITW
jgi:nucleoside-diphosphate-sugar epimerase